LPASGRPVLQYNLPYPDMPSLGQIARDLALMPIEPCPRHSPTLPPGVRRYLFGFVESHLFQIDPESLLQDPDWYENLDPPAI
jgi:hypothetical protein